MGWSHRAPAAVVQPSMAMAPPTDGPGWSHRDASVPKHSAMQPTLFQQEEWSVFKEDVARRLAVDPSQSPQTGPLACCRLCGVSLTGNQLADRRPQANERMDKALRAVMQRAALVHEEKSQWYREMMKHDEEIKHNEGFLKYLQHEYTDQVEAYIGRAREAHLQQIGRLEAQVAALRRRHDPLEMERYDELARFTDPAFQEAPFAHERAPSNDQTQSQRDDSPDGEFQSVNGLQDAIALHPATAPPEDGEEPVVVSKAPAMTFLGAGRRVEKKKADPNKWPAPIPGRTRASWLRKQ